MVSFVDLSVIYPLEIWYMNVYYIVLVDSAIKNGSATQPFLIYIYIYRFIYVYIHIYVFFNSATKTRVFPSVKYVNQLRWQNGEVIDADASGTLHVTELVQGLLKIRGDLTKSHVAGDLQRDLALIIR